MEGMKLVILYFVKVYLYLRHFTKGETQIEVYKILHLMTRHHISDYKDLRWGFEEPCKLEFQLWYLALESL